MSNAILTDRVSPEVQEGLAQLLVEAQAYGRDDELIVSILRESADLLKERQPRGSSLTAERAKYLLESGTYTRAELDAAEQAVEGGALVEMVRKTRLTNVMESLSAAEVAARLHLDASSVRHRSSKKYLYSFLIGNKRRYPTWQFGADEARVLPHLAKVVEAIPAGMHPATVRGFMTNPKDSLHRPEAPQMTPVEWLAEGGDYQTVLDILETYLKS